MPEASGYTDRTASSVRDDRSVDLGGSRPVSGRDSPSSQLWPEPTEDRRRAGIARTMAIAALLAVGFRVAMLALPVSGRSTMFIDVAAGTAVIAVFVLRSIPLRWIVRSYGLISGILMLRFGWLTDEPGVSGAREVLIWTATTVGALALCPTPDARSDRHAPAASESARSHLDRSLNGDASAVSPTPDGPGQVRPWGTAARAALAATVVVLAVVLLVGPVAGRRTPAAPSRGEAPDQFDRGPNNSLSVQDELEMTTRPRLTDAVVMTVQSEIVSFWRTTTYDQWNGTKWSRSDGGTVRPLFGGLVTLPADDVAGSNGRPSTQTFRLQGGFANSMPVAPSAVSVDAADRLFQLADGSLVMPGGVGKGATYTVESRQMPTSIEQLGQIDAPVPENLLRRYAQPAETTDRVRELARRIVADAGADSELAKVQALEAWMGDNLEYSLDAPLAPPGVDVVDDFLFESKVGWCEQIASSLVVMLREVGVPVRLAVGFAPGEQDGNGDRFVVRERDAHSWAEVWFPDVGWVPFDPTAEVPLAGDAATSNDLPIGFAGLAVVLLFIGAVAVVAAPLARRLHAWRERRSARRAARRLAAERWDVRVEQELEELGREVGRPRAPSETVSGHARELAAVTGRPELAEQGAAVDDHRYSPSSPGEPPT